MTATIRGMTDTPAPKKPPLTSAQKQAALRARRAAAGLTQLVVFAHPEDHQAIRLHVDRLNAKRRPKP